MVGTPWRNLTYMVVHTDEGLSGVGETRMLGHTDALLGYLREVAGNHILGSDPFAVEDLVRGMKYGDYGRAGEIVMSGIACVETACWDIKGQASRFPWVQLEPGAGMPDGLTVDADGAVWVALWDGAAVRRYRPNGRFDLALPLPVARPTACVFGRHGLTDLYITTATTGLAHPARPAGSLLVVPDAGHGLPQPPFAG